MAEKNTILVVGAGQMGRGIAQLAAQAGNTVLFNDVDPDIVETGLAVLTASLTRSSESGQLSQEQKRSILSRIVPSTNIKDSVRADFVIEAATENMTIKKQIFHAASEYITPETLLASCTSSLSITEIASATDCPDRVIGTHFMYPVAVMPLVEIVRGLKTSDETARRTADLITGFNKETVEVGDHPGLISNRVLMPLINEAVSCVFEGVADIETVDKIMQQGLNHPMGPLRLADLIGLDTCLTIMENLAREYKNGKYRPCPLLRNMVKSGKLGRKSGEGFYSYPN